MDDQVLEFGVSGKLIMNNLVMYDRQTESLWAQINGRALVGPLQGEELEFIPSRLIAWEDWKSRHPDTLALVKGYAGERDPYSSYYLSGGAGSVGRAVVDNRLPLKDFVIGVTLEDEAVAYPLRELESDPLVNDQVGDVPIVVVYESESGASAVFRRRVQGRVLEFERTEGVTLTDVHSGTRWNGLTGEATEGELAGAQLRSVAGHQSFWFSWVDFHPDTRVYGQGE